MRNTMAGPHSAAIGKADEKPLFKVEIKAEMVATAARREALVQDIAAKMAEKTDNGEQAAKLVLDVAAIRPHERHATIIPDTIGMLKKLASSLEFMNIDNELLVYAASPSMKMMMEKMRLGTTLKLAHDIGAGSGARTC